MPEKYRKLILDLKNKCPNWFEFTFAAFLSLSENMYYLRQSQCQMK